MAAEPFVVIVMGVAGSGKSTIGRALAARLGCPFLEGDAYHPPENIARMAKGQPLNDADRAPWLAKLHELIAGHLARGTTAVLAASGLKESYRARLRSDLDRVFFVFLEGEFDLIYQRMLARDNHYMRAEMLRSQFETLERPGPGEALAIDTSRDPADIVNQILQWLPR